MRGARALLGSLAAAAVAVPGECCPVCYSASDGRVLSAFFASTMLLSLLPLALIGAAVAYLVYQQRRG